jgi:hypothetical protein
VSASDSVQVIYPPATAPAINVPTSSYNGSYTASWTSVATATSYALEESFNGGPWATAYSGSAISKAFASMAAGTHAYRVHACNAAGCGVDSATDSVLVTYPPATAPVLTAPATNGTGSYSVSWTAVSTATSYQLDENLNGGAWTQFQNDATRSQAFTSKADGTYGYRVKACNVAGCGPLASDTTIVDLLPPTTPTLTVPALGAANTAYIISWSAPINTSSYLLQVTSGGTWATSYSGALNSVSRTSSVGTYSYRIQACSAKGCSPFSAAKTITVERDGCPTCLMGRTPRPKRNAATTTEGGP